MNSQVKAFSDSFTSEYTTDTDINTLWSTFKTFCSFSIDSCVPSKMTSSRFHQPWINIKTKRLSRRKKRAYRRAKKSGNPEDVTRYKQLQKDTQYQFKKAYNSYVNNMVSEGSSAKKLYSFINGKRCESSGVSVLKGDGISHSDPKEKSTILNEQFVSAFTKGDLNAMPSMSGNPYPKMRSFTINNKGVLKLLKDLNPHKAQGLDAIPSCFLKECAEEIAPALTLVYEASLQQGTIQDDWKKTSSHRYLRKETRVTRQTTGLFPSPSYICCRTMEHIIYSQVMQHLDIHKILCDQQHGFRKRRSCDSQLLVTIQDISANLDEGKQIDAVLLDFSKAFDKVPHQRLLLKLRHYGIRDSTLQWVQSFLLDRSKQVRVKGQASESSPVTLGVPQGKVLGPLLFLLYINDMPMKVSSTARLFADDSLLYRRIGSSQDRISLQEDLDRLQQWEKE